MTQDTRTEEQKERDKKTVGIIMKLSGGSAAPDVVQTNLDRLRAKGIEVEIKGYDVTGGKTVAAWIAEFRSLVGF